MNDLEKFAAKAKLKKSLLKRLLHKVVGEPAKPLVIRFPKDIRTKKINLSK